MFDFARAPDGRLVLCGSELDRGGRRAAFVAAVTGDAQSPQIARTQSYGPGDVVTDDGAARHFDAALKPLGSFIPQSTVKAAIDITAADTNFLASSKDAVAWLCGRANRYVEISLDGKILDLELQNAPAHMLLGSAFAMTADGDALINVFAPAFKRRTFYILDKSTRRSVPAGEVDARGLPVESGILFGSEGNLLVADRAGDRFSLCTLELVK